MARMPRITFCNNKQTLMWNFKMKLDTSISVKLGFHVIPLYKLIRRKCFIVYRIFQKQLSASVKLIVSNLNLYKGNFKRSKREYWIRFIRVISLPSRLSSAHFRGPCTPGSETGSQKTAGLITVKDRVVDPEFC